MCALGCHLVCRDVHCYISYLTSTTIISYNCVYSFVVLVLFLALLSLLSLFFFFFFNDTATTEIYTLSLHDALPISGERLRSAREPVAGREIRAAVTPRTSAPAPAAARDMALDQLCINTIR